MALDSAMIGGQIMEGVSGSEKKADKRNFNSEQLM
jgi:hypothetical protein